MYIHSQPVCPHGYTIDWIGVVVVGRWLPHIDNYRNMCSAVHTYVYAQPTCFSVSVGALNR